MPNKKNEHWSKRHTKITRQQLRERIGAYSVEPFADVVAFLLHARPTLQGVKDWAEKNPDKWANAVATFAKLQGFAEYKVIEHNHTLNVAELSDAEILVRLTQLRETTQLSISGQNLSNTISPIIEGEFHIESNKDRE